MKQYPLHASVIQIKLPLKVNRLSPFCLHAPTSRPGQANNQNAEPKGPAALCLPLWMVEVSDPFLLLRGFSITTSQ